MDSPDRVEISKRLYQRLREVHGHLPPALRRVYAPLFRWRYSNFFQLTVKTGFRTFLPLKLVRGVTREGHALRFAYFGYEAPERAFWSAMVFPGGYESVDLGHCFAWQVAGRLEKTGDVCDMVLMESSRLSGIPFRGVHRFTVPRWIFLETDISGPLKVILRKSRNGFADAARRVRQQGLSYEITHDTAWFDRFYEQMYLPLIEKKHHAGPIRRDYACLKKVFCGAGLLLVKKQGVAVAGILNEYEGKTLRLRYLGVRTGPRDWVRLGVIGALYYFSLREGKDKGCEVMDLTATPPLLTHGLTRFKRAYHSRMSPLAKIRSKDYADLYVLRESAGLRAFFARNPFVYLSAEKKLCRAVFRDLDAELDAEAFCSLLMKTDIPGLAATRFY